MEFTKLIFLKCCNSRNKSTHTPTCTHTNGHPKSLKSVVCLASDVKAAEFEGGAGDLGVHGGHGHRVVLLLGLAPAQPTQREAAEVLLEVAVEEAVEDGVDPGRGHGQQVAEGEERVVRAVHDHLVVPVDDGVEDVEWQPADGEGHHDAEEHDVDAPHLAVALPALADALHHVAPPS